jgi:phosphatidylserine/phosphatidylglycerophosphate/cardiolipin synthase-like enzyme
MAGIEARTLSDGGQTAAEVAGWLVRFVEPAQHSLDLALYDLRLSAPVAAVVGDAFRAAAARGVAVRVIYNVDHPALHADVARPPIPPPPAADPGLADDLGGPARPVPGVPDLMHHKYVVRDGAAVWTGSTNWTDDSWQREENIVVTVESPAVAAWYASNFQELWDRPDVEASGATAEPAVAVAGASVRAWFCPGGGQNLAHRIAKAIGAARRRIRITSPVLTSGPVLGTLAEVASDGRVDVAGVLDATQMAQVLHQWHENGNGEWKVPLLARSLAGGAWSAKESTPWGHGTVHDYMHAKATVADDTVFVGSYNLSHSGEKNAENVLEIRDAALADQMASFCDDIRRRYPPARFIDRGGRS